MLFLVIGTGIGRFSGLWVVGGLKFLCVFFVGFCVGYFLFFGFCIYLGVFYF